MSAAHYRDLTRNLQHLSWCAERAATYADEVAAHVDVHPDNALHAPRRDDLASELRKLAASIDAANRIIAAIVKDEAGQK